MKKHLIFKISAAALALTLTIPFLASCGKLPKEKAVVGTVGDEKVYYDEIYYLAEGYKDELITKYGTDTEGAKKELDILIKENLIVNYAMLSVCKSAGLKLKDVSNSEIDAVISDEIEVKYGGDEGKFYKALEESGMTERYFRYVVALDLLCARLGEAYAEQGLVLSAEKDVRDHIKKNFIRVYHLVLFNDEGDDKEANLAEMKETLEKLKNGEKLFDLIQYHEDNYISEHGYYITKGSMDKAYEEAAFALDVGETSEIITATGQHNYVTVEGYYIIQRYELDDKYVTTYFDTLKNEYYNQVINEDYQKILKELTFSPNENYAELDLLSLEAPEKSSDTVVVVVIIALAVAAITATVVIVVVKNNLKKKNVSSKSKSSKKRSEKK